MTEQVVENLLLKIVGDRKHLPDYFSDDEYDVLTNVLAQAVSEKDRQAKKEREIFKRTLTMIALAIKDHSDWQKYTEGKKSEEYHGYFSYLDIVQVMFFGKNATEEEIVAKCRELKIQPEKWLEITKEKGEK